MWKNVLLLLAASVVAVGILELGIRITMPIYDPSGIVSFRYDDAGVPLGIPGPARQWKNTGDYDIELWINDDGLRDPKDLRTGTAQDLYVVGDSFTFGHGVELEERYSNHLERMLDRRVFNLGIPTDFGGYEALVTYARGLGARIEHLIIGVCMENDLHDYLEGAAGYVPRTPAWLRVTKEWLLGRSAIYIAFTHMVHSAGPLRRAAIGLGLAVRDGVPPASGVTHDAIITGSVDRLELLVERQQVSEVTVLVIPSRGLWAGPHRAAEATRHERFVELLRETGFRVVDLRERLEASGAPLDYHFPHDGHWNASGHRVAAEELAAALRATEPAADDSAGQRARPDPRL